MKATGIVRKIDDLGRVVIPKEIRRTLRIREGDPLEIFTEKDGEVIFKKYSPVGELSEFAVSIAESLYKTAGCGVAVADRDEFIAVFGAPKRELLEKHVSRELENIMEERSVYQYKAGEKAVPLTEDGKHMAGTAAPIVSEGDVMGCIVMFSDDGKIMGETEYKLAQTVAGFLGRQMEN
ncbi:MAG: AbrB/MazE/SpoVT family DNA-binding domain-containing protein [Oscillospiraceae bacterium]|nr:AbrB/MazE/SpoVT family DNA-binding domain-containing protein [Oscillospiraceae bacterium]